MARGQGQIRVADVKTFLDGTTEIVEMNKRGLRMALITMGGEFITHNQLFSLDSTLARLYHGQ